MGEVVSPCSQDDALMTMIVISVLGGIGVLSTVSVTRMIAGRRFERQLRCAASPEEAVARNASTVARSGCAFSVDRFRREAVFHGRRTTDNW